ncbi:MAG: hypothetical protein ACLQNE_29380 [Thermoguttaceae bacterium]|jgi:predicted transposase YdaD
MPHPYDASTKYLVQTRLADWLPLCGRTTTAELQVIDADLATVTAAADRVLRVCEDPSWLLHVELQASRDSDLLPNLPAYNILLERRHGVLVRTVVVLLRKAADWPELTGTFQRGFRGEPPYLTFRYEVVRVWELPLETILSGGLGILPLAPLSAVAEAELPGVIRRMDERIRAEATPDEAGTLWTAADVLMGLRYPRQLVAQLLQGVHGMKESVTYQAIIEEGEVKGMLRARQDDLLQLGRRRFGPAVTEIETALRGIADRDRLARMIGALLDVSSWEELLATP